MRKSEWIELRGNCRRQGGVRILAVAVVYSFLAARARLLLRSVVCFNRLGDDGAGGVAFLVILALRGNRSRHVAALQPSDASKFAKDAHEALNDEVKAGKRPKPANKAEERVFRLVLALGKQVLPRRQLVAEIGMRQNSRHTFSNNYIRPAYDNGYIDFSYPSSPHKPKQAYRLTSKGLELYAALTSKEVIC